MIARGFLRSVDDAYDGRRPLSPLAQAWRRWGWLTLWVVPGLLTLELVGLAGCWLAPRGGLVEALALVVVIVPLGVAALVLGLLALAGAALLVAGPWRWARQRTLDWYSR